MPGKVFCHYIFSIAILLTFHYKLYSCNKNLISVTENKSNYKNFCIQNYSRLCNSLVSNRYIQCFFLCFSFFIFVLMMIKHENVNKVKLHLKSSQTCKMQPFVKTVNG